MEMDLDQTRYLDYAGLKRYCWHVAGVVGILSASIFGVTQAGDAAVRGKAGPRVPAHQHHPRRRRGCAQGPHLPAGQRAAAVRRDGGRPAERAPQREIRSADALPGRSARSSAYDEAFALLPPEDRRAQRPGLMMAAIYRTLLDEIERDGFHVLNQRISLTPLRKLWLAWKTYVRG